MCMGDKDGGRAVRLPMGSGLAVVIFQILPAPRSVCFLLEDVRYYLPAPRWTRTSHCVTQLVPLCFKVNSRQCKSLSENFTMSAVCPEPALFPNHGISDFLSWKVQQNQERYWSWCYIFIRCGVLKLFLLNIGRGIWRAETGLLFPPFEKKDGFIMRTDIS